MDLTSHHLTVLPQNKLGYENSGQLGPMLLRLVAPNEPSSSDWLKENLCEFNVVGTLVPSAPWNEPVSGQLPASTLAKHEPEYVIFKTHREIVAQVSCLEQRRSAHTLLTFIVWFRLQRNPDQSIVRTQVYALRRVVISLAKDNKLPTGLGLTNQHGWLNDLEVMLADDDGFVSSDFTILKLLLKGELALGQRQKTVSQISGRRSPRKLFMEALWGEAPNNEWDFSTETFDNTVKGSAQNEVRQPSKDLGDDDGQPTDMVTLENSQRTGRDARHQAQRLFNAVLIGSIAGYDHKETYTPRVAAYLLSLLRPCSPESAFALVAIILGRPLKRMKKIDLQGDGLVIESVQNVEQLVTLLMPTHLTIGSDPISVDRLNQLLKTQFKQAKSLIASRVGINGLARFGVMRFHGQIGIVQSEQLQGELSKGATTAIYGSLSTADFQRSLNRVVQAFCGWVKEEAPYLCSEWRMWASEIESSLPSAGSIGTEFGSQYVSRLDSSGQRSIAKKLRDSFALYQQAISIQSRQEAALHYLTQSAQALNIAYMAITGARPLTEITKVSLGEGFVLVADKRCYGDQETRMLSVPDALISAMRSHLNNVANNAKRLAVKDHESLAGIRHPFVTIGPDKNKAFALHHLTQSQVTEWQRDAMSNDLLKANAFRHGKATDMLKAGVPDGVVAHQLGHDRGWVSGSSPYLSTPAFIDSDHQSDWVPLIKLLDW